MFADLKKNFQKIKVFSVFGPNEHSRCQNEFTNIIPVLLGTESGNNAMDQFGQQKLIQWNFSQSSMKHDKAESFIKSFDIAIKDDADPMAALTAVANLRKTLPLFKDGMISLHCGGETYLTQSNADLKNIYKQITAPKGNPQADKEELPLTPKEIAEFIIKRINTAVEGGQDIDEATQGIVEKYLPLCPDPSTRLQVAGMLEPSTNKDILIKHDIYGSDMNVLRVAPKTPGKQSNLQINGLSFPHK
jgi:hypothetical protein